MNEERKSYHEPADETRVEQYGEAHEAQAEESARTWEDEKNERDLAENNALARAFDDVRRQSAKSWLTTPDRWARLGLVPAHMSAEDFEMLAYEYWEEHAGVLVDEAARRHAQAPKAARPSPFGGRTVGVPPKIGKPQPAAESAPEEAEIAEAKIAEDGATEATASEAEAAHASQASHASTHDDAPATQNADVFADLDLPPGYTLDCIDGEWVLVPEVDGPTSVRLDINCANIVALVGMYSYYLYDSSVMTDAFAHWAFLAAEDNPLMSFVECVREEGRVYPRPMSSETLENPPFNMSPQKIESLWEQTRDSGAYPDIKRVCASNGDVFYFSDTYLTREYAQSLAEWLAVEWLRSV